MRCVPMFPCPLLDHNRKGSKCCSTPNAVRMRYDFLPPLRTHQAADSSSAVVSFGFPNPSSDLNCADTSSIAAFNCAIFSFKFFRVFSSPSSSSRNRAGLFRGPSSSSFSISSDMDLVICAKNGPYRKSFFLVCCLSLKDRDYTL
jgi:hypothetical protein